MVTDTIYGDFVLELSKRKLTVEFAKNEILDYLIKS
jgi:hypothetical protein